VDQKKGKNKTLIWRELPGNPMYSISNVGQVRRNFFNDYSLTKKGRVCPFYVKLSNHKEGYLMCNIQLLDGKRKKYLVHRLVGLTFLPSIKGKPYINHINMDKKDNRIENIEWVTMTENNTHSYSAIKKKKGNLGFLHKEKKIKMHNLKTNKITIYDTLTECCRENNFTLSHVSNVCNGKVKKAYGCVFVYI